MRYIMNFDSSTIDKSSYDVLVVGTGIAGLFTALNISKDLSVMLISKEDMITNNSYLAQGGIAVTFNENGIEGHIEDTLKAGGFYNDLKAVEILVEEGKQNVEKLFEYGVEFDKKNGNILFTKEGGHSERRIIHKKDYTGKEIIEKLIKVVKEKNNITCYENAFLVDVFTDDNKITGAFVLINENKLIIKTNNIVISTGGIGKIFLNSTNSSISTGDGIAIASRAGAEIEDMEFIQFHPTPFSTNGNAFLISEAVRGEGGILRNGAGEEFMEKYHLLKDLAPRDIVSRSILKEQKKQGNKNIYLDVTHFKKGYFENRFPSIFDYCISQSIDPRIEWIPINPAEHYLMGGIKTDYNGKTTIDGLYSCGESARTGVQGANRLASNSLSEGIVFGNRVAQHINKNIKNVKNKIQEKNTALMLYNSEFKKDVIRLKTIMDQSANIVRKSEQLEKALSEVNIIIDKYKNYYNLNISFLEFKNMLLVSSLIFKMSIQRHESLGSHYLENKSDE